MKIFGSPPTSSPSLRFGMSAQSSAPNAGATQGAANRPSLPSLQAKTASQFGASSLSSPFSLPPLQAQSAPNAPIHPLNLPFYNPYSVEAQTRQFVSDVLAATKSDGLKTQSAGQPMVSKNLTAAFPFNANKWYASPSMLVVQLSPEVSVPAQFSKSNMAQATRTKEATPVFGANTTAVAANSVAAPQARPTAKNAMTAIAHNAPAEVSSAAFALSPFEQKMLQSSSKPFFGQSPTADVFTPSSPVQNPQNQPSASFADRIGATLQSADYSNNPFDVLSRIGPNAENAATQAKPAQEAAAPETAGPPAYALQAYQRILRGTKNVPEEVVFTAEMDHRLNDNPNSIATYAYLPKSGTVLTEPMMGAAGIQSKDQWYAPVVRFGAQAFKPLVEVAPWLNVAKMNVQDDNLWFGSRWNVPLANHQTADGQDVQIYQLTRLPNGQMAQVIGNHMLSDLPLAPAPGKGHSQALDGAPQPSQAQTLADNLKMNASVKEANALTTPKLQSTNTANANAYATAPVTLSATRMSQEQPTFKGRAAYRDWVHEQVARMEQQGHVLAT